MHQPMSVRLYMIGSNFIRCNNYLNLSILAFNTSKRFNYPEDTKPRQKGRDKKNY